MMKNLRNIWRGLPVTIMLLCSVTIYAQNMEELKFAMKRIRLHDRLTYKYETTAIFPTGDVDTLLTEYIIDRKRQYYYCHNRLMTVLVNEKWLYKADHTQQVISIFNVDKYNTLHKELPLNIGGFFRDDQLAFMTDSLLLGPGKIVTGAVNGSTTHYTLSFPKDYYIQYFELKYHHLLNLPEYVKMEYRDNSFLPGRGQTIFTIECSGYSTHIPEEKLDIKHYCKVSEQGVVLTKYKNYKINKIL